MSVYCFDKPVALMTCFWRESQHWSRVSFACNFSTHVSDHYLFVALYNHWIEETVSFKMSHDFLRQVLITTFLGAHEADHYSIARFHECDTWLSFVSATVRMNMKSFWNFGRVSAVLFTTTRLCGELRPRLATRNGHQSMSGTCVALCAILAASVGGSGGMQCSRCSRFTRNVKLFQLDPHRRSPAEVSCAPCPSTPSPT